MPSTGIQTLRGTSPARAHATRGRCIPALAVILAAVGLYLHAVPGVAQDAAPAAFVPPVVTRHATDLTGTLSSSDLAGLNRRLEEFDRRTSTQIVVVIVGTVEPLTIEEAGIKVAEANGIGGKEKDNGALLLIAKDDRQVRIEVGYGLEGVLPDILAGQIIRNEIIPRFRSGDFAGGVEAGTEAIMKATRNEYTADEKKPESRRNIVPMIVIFIIIALIISRNMRGGGGIRRSGFGGFPPIGGGFGGGGFGGGFGGGGFSGGGGSFGGGGASGRW